VVLKAGCPSSITMIVDLETSNGFKGNPSNVGPIFHLTPSGGATCGSLNGQTILGAPYPKRRDGLCYMDHQMLSGRLNDRVYVGGSDEAPI